MTAKDEQPQPKDLGTGERLATTGRAVFQGIAHEARGEHETEEGARQTTEAAEVERIIDGWPDLLRLVGSIRAGTVVPSHVITKLAANPRQSSLARALTELGRLERTRFILDLLRSPPLRHAMQASLNKGEAGNNLRKAVFFHRLGQVRDRAYEDQQHRARGLNLLVAAIVPWNTRYLGAAVAALRGRGHAIGDELLKHVWPLHWEHINLTGDYTWADPGTGEPERLRELRLERYPGPTDLRRAA